VELAFPSLQAGLEFQEAANPGGDYTVYIVGPEDDSVLHPAPEAATRVALMIERAPSDPADGVEPGP
jgi:hypothetical protein